MVSVSIIVTCEEQRMQLEQLLSKLLTMQYEGEYEVIVVDKMHDKDMNEWLEDMERQYPNLCHTFCPRTASAPQKKDKGGSFIQRLALTLGAKAAAYEWLVCLRADVQLPTEDWLLKLTACSNDETDVVVGITNRKRRWNWLTSYIFRCKFSLFHPSTAVILCRRNVLLQGKAVKLTKHQVIKL